MHVNDMGVIAATVQWRGRVEDMAATGASLALAFSLLWYGFFWFLAPELAQLAGSADATPLVRLLTLTIVIDGITAVRVGVIQRTFQQDKLTQAIFVGFLGNAAIAISLAANGAGPYSFVMGQLAQSVITGTIVMFVARMPFRYGWNPTVAKRILKFGLPLALALGIESVLLFSDSFVVGHLLGPTLLGYYLLAFSVSNWVPGMVGVAVRYVSIPSFSRLAEHDPAVLAQGVRRAVSILFAFVTPVAVTMAVLGPELIEFLYGPRWVPAAAALQFLAVVMVARMLVALNFDVLTSLGRTSAPVWLNLSWAVVLIPCLILGTELGGIRGASMANAIVAVVVAIPLGVRALSRGGVSLRPAARRFVRTMIAGMLCGTTMVALSLLISGSAVLELVVAGGVGWLVYCCAVLPVSKLRELAARIPVRRARATA
jgi:PST family polysaccharide transporter